MIGMHGEPAQLHVEVGHKQEIEVALEEIVVVIILNQDNATRIYALVCT